MVRCLRKPSQLQLLGTIDDIQKLHIRTVPLGECVSRIAYQPETNTIAILTYRYEVFNLKMTKSFSTFYRTELALVDLPFQHSAPPEPLTPITLDLRLKP